MPTAPAPASETQANKAAPVAKKRFSGKKMKIAAIVLGVMVLQAVAAALLLPRGHTSGSEAAETGGHAEDAHAKADNLVEADIDTFSCSIELDDGILWYVSFRLFAAVPKESLSHFTEAVTEKFKARVRQSVVKVVRMSSIADLRDPQLDLLKRNLKTEINNVLPERYVHEIIVSEIRIMQQ